MANRQAQTAASLLWQPKQWVRLTNLKNLTFNLLYFACVENGGIENCDFWGTGS